MGEMADKIPDAGHVSGSRGRACRRDAGGSAGRSGRALRHATSLHTLGPAGTNCELAARRWFEHGGRSGEIVLYPTLEEAARGALATPGGGLLAPVAYPNLHTVMYSHVDHLFLADSMVMDTHRMVLARRPGTGAPVTVASHPAPLALVPHGVDVTLVTSNSQAASDCAAGLVDACITTEAAMAMHQLELVRDFGPVAMAFTIHLRTAEEAGFSARPEASPVTNYGQRGSCDA